MRSGAEARPTGSGLAGAVVRTVSATALATVMTVAAHAQAPPTAPPADWGPVSINLEDVPYPHPVHMVEFELFGEFVRMAYMDVAAAASPARGTVVVLHGGNYFAEAYSALIDALRQDGFRVVAIDQVGYGRSSKPIIPYSLDMHAANTRRVLDAIGIERAAILGHSMGGMVATRFALLYPDATSHLVLLNSIGLTDARAGREWREPRPALERSYESIVGTIRGHVAEWREPYLEYVRIHYGWTLSGEWPRLAAIRALNGDVMRTPIVHDWPQIRAPALVIGGELDGPRYPELARNAAAAFPNGQVVLLPGVGHNPHWEALDRLRPPLVEFLTTAR